MKKRTKAVQKRSARAECQGLECLVLKHNIWFAPSNLTYRRLEPAPFRPEAHGYTSIPLASDWEERAKEKEKISPSITAGAAAQEDEEHSLLKRPVHGIRETFAEYIYLSKTVSIGQWINWKRKKIFFFLCVERERGKERIILLPTSISLQIVVSDREWQK